MRLAVDARLMARHPRGMGQYARALVEPVGKQLVAVLPKSRTTSEWPSTSQGISFDPWWEQWVLPRVSRRLGATHLLCPSNTGPVARMRDVRKIVVVHDLIFLLSLDELPASRSLYQNIGRLYRRAVVPRAVASADVVVTVSEYSRGELCERLAFAPERVHVIPNSVSDEWFVEAPLDDASRKPYLLSVAGEAPSKNLSGLLQAFSAVHRRFSEKVMLRVVGVKPAFHASFASEAERLGIADVVAFEPFVEEPELRRLYRQARAFVLPSLYEGFGIPLLEAMASGTPVVCSNTTSLPEVVGPAALLFDPRDIDSIADALVGVLADTAESLRRAYVGLARAANYRRGAVGERIASFWDGIR